jgi:hypothetical protein
MEDKLLPIILLGYALALAQEVFSEEDHALIVRVAQYQCKLL